MVRLQNDDGLRTMSVFTAKKFHEFDVRPLQTELAMADDLWGQDRTRLEYAGSPFSETSDIYVRFARDWEIAKGPHFPEWLPAASRLPSCRPIVFDLMARFRASHLGGVLLTRIPPGGSVKPHSDLGSWHAEFYNAKVYVILSANDQCVNRFESDEFNMKTGEAWLFNNLITHSVENHGGSCRDSMIVCMRVD